MLKYLQHTSSLRKAVSSTSIFSPFLWTRHALGGKVGVTPVLPLGLQPGQPLIGGKRENLERYVSFPQFTKVSCMGHLTVVKCLQLCFTPPHSNSNLPFQIYVTHHLP